MGNTTSDVNDSLKAQADSENGPDLYKLVNVNGGGELVRLMKIALKTKDYSELDNFIKTEVVKYLYNNGEGEHIPIENIVHHRCGNKVPKPIAKNITNLTKLVENRRVMNTKELCFRMDKCGAVGESLLLLCMLNGTAIYHELAKRLIKHFPKMVNDIYISEDYYGEAALHMAIVSEDPSMVKFLLLNGADVHQRCCGKFFCPEDQKTNQENTLLHEIPIFSVNTNYIGYTYFGEYPLSFAAILDQEECVRLLISKGADPNKQDFNGNTVLHMLVINNNLSMFKFMLNFNASLDIKNRQGLTPLTLAAKLARKEMFQLILEKLRHVWFTYADISCGSYPLATIDTIAKDGTTDTTSAIYLIANGETVEHLDLLEGLIVDLLNKKWNSYIKYKFYFEVIMFILYVILAISIILMKRIYFDYLINSMQCAPKGEHLIQDCQCAYLYPNDPNRYVRVTFELTVLLYSIMYLVIMTSEIFSQKFSIYVQTLLFNPSKIIFILSLLCYLLMIPMRFSCKTSVEDVLVVLSIIFKSTYILYLGRGFRTISTFIFVIHRVLRTNFFRFLIIFGVFMIGFSQAFYIAFEFGKNSDHNLFTSALKSFFDCLVISLRNLEETYRDIKKSEYQVVATFLFLCFLVVVSLLLINLLIAMMAHTYNITSELKREWLRQWAKQVLTIEQNLPIKERLKQQKKYANTLSNGEKAFIVTWKQTEEERNLLKTKKHIFRGQIQKFFNNEDFTKI